ncbi:sensor histidine kinase [Rathayibacter iranicus]|uniref:Sensor-like histidine kinase SenX3 n=2 Tax=Rathayibacter iranicus TaxID=59737 RepID=A0AAD1AFN8_9MICO|nr:sensor histidine kinase [Rathayibacter iranicus]AZZ56150.1 sensor histidine kinase [Rathayibacter iranicus]MWV30153.1 PAS domain-containing protein [Rathayibacter iranicus NCPPB 2253 = VKM Ac-1602]PPI46218.1 histidine kinase [Rathayibacter iranicus]PPI59592.1 histidine kinase [Rathayibacter iranicus]PPI71070.1 histidine kinase [Rathayibacter iranicus]
MRFASHVLVLQLATVSAAVLVCAGVVTALSVQQLRGEAEETALAIARTVAEDPDVREAVTASSAEPGVPAAAELRRGPLETIAAAVEQRTGALFIVITDDQGIRLAHPDENRLGERVSTSPDEALAGRESVSWGTGTLGESARAKVPVFSEGEGRVVGEVSIGFARSSVFTDLPAALLGVLAAALAGLVLAAVASVFIRRRLLRLTLGLAPEELTSLVQDQAAVLDGVDEGVLALDRDGRVGVCNARAAAILGSDDPTGRALHGRALSELALPTPLADAIDAALRSADPPRRGGEEGFVIRSRIVYVDIRRVTRGDRDLGVVVVLRDRTDLAALSRRLDAVGAMTNALRVQRHEFANRLHVVAGLLDAGRTGSARDYLDEVLTRGPLKYPVQHADRLQEPYLQALVGAKGIEAAERGVLLTLGEETLVRGTVIEPEDVATVVGNLVDNAVRAAVEGRRDVRFVEIELLDDGTALFVTVADSGDGVVSPESLFDRAGTSDPVADDGRVHGRGFGLRLCREVATRRGGEVWLADAGGVESGAVLCARLPGSVRPPERDGDE